MSATAEPRVQEWIEVSVGEIVAPGPYSAATGPFGSSIGSRFFRTSGVPVIRGGNLSADTSVRLRDIDLIFLTEEKAAEFPRSTVRKGDLVFTCWGTINQVGLIDDGAAYTEYVISNKQMKLTPNHNRVSSEFLYYLFSGPAMQNEILSGTIGSSIPGFNLTRLRSLRILLPPLKEQLAIAQALSDADEAVQSTKRLIAKKQAMKQGMMQQLLTGRTRLQGFTDRWRKTTLGDVATLQRGFDLPARLRRYGAVPIVSSSGVSGWHNRPMVQAPGVVTGRYGTIGEVFFETVNFWPLNTTLWVSDFHGNSVRFIYYLLHGIDFASHSGKSGVPGVNRNDLHSEVVSLPGSVGEQRAIAEVLDGAEAELKVLQKRLTKVRAVKQGMMQQLLTGHTRLSAEEATS